MEILKSGKELPFFPKLLPLRRNTILTHFFTGFEKKILPTLLFE
jgi:hypothetical protein